MGGDALDWGPSVTKVTKVTKVMMRVTSVIEDCAVVAIWRSDVSSGS
jgi:hypothetical protein